MICCLGDQGHLGAVMALSFAEPAATVPLATVGLPALTATASLALPARTGVFKAPLDVRADPFILFYFYLFSNKYFFKYS